MRARRVRGGDASNIINGRFRLTLHTQLPKIRGNPKPPNPELRSLRPSKHQSHAALNPEILKPETLKPNPKIINP